MRLYPPHTLALRQSAARAVAIAVEAKVTTGPPCLQAAFSRRCKSTAAAAAIPQQHPSNYVELKHVPKYPFVGSALSVK